MITFPNAKINIGLNILSERADGYHNIETVFCPIPLYDILEIIPSAKKTSFRCTGIRIPPDTGENLVVKAYRLLADDYSLPPVQMHLHKQVPPGSGLGGGSSDGAFALVMLDKIFNLRITAQTMKAYAQRLGSDCTFFLRNEPVFATGTGNKLKKIKLDLTAYYLVLVIPPLFISTADAYRNTKTGKPSESLAHDIQKPVREWKHCISNRFESFAFQQYPSLAKIKNQLVQSGAIFASLSGSGSAVFGIFEQAIHAQKIFPGCSIYCRKMSPVQPESFIMVPWPS